ncbi:hypothetical protein A8135_13850 [Legionella jamestowniensis]|uniref:Polysaccharide chain length determinant N-terminal domain-containing protein n=1 Tax=Legionella jamestowniensis TaxID=455 RepID=A0ABX2XSV6_9GAMM|nr:Wzz/FepE/Etk N-terminal domain-containing protein [Legionella jamestowniensis]OCH97573.1 hypothetical protein A8135_13850 [Legionella jamestowniensis]
MEGKHSVVMPNDEIDLVDLFRTIWKRKWLVLLVTFICIFFGALYAFLKTPIFEVKAYVSPPSIADIAAFNKGFLQANSSIDDFTTDKIYQIFLEKLVAETTKRKFYNQYFLPTISAKKKKNHQDYLYKTFFNLVSVKEITKTPLKYLVTIKGSNPSQTVLWSKQYLELARKSAVEDILLIRNAQYQQLAKSIKNEIDTNREIAKQERLARLVRLKEALTVAKAVGISHPSLSAINETTTDLSAFTSSTSYLQGVKALETEIENLRARSSDDAYINDLPRLKSAYKFYNALKIDPEGGMVFRLDGVIKKPDAPIAPNKMLIIQLSMILGLILGTGLVIVFPGKNKIS